MFLRVNTLSPIDDLGDPGGVEFCFGTACTKCLKSDGCEISFCFNSYKHTILKKLQNTCSNQTFNFIFLNLFTLLPGTGVLGMLERLIANSLAIRS